jgi:murein DD-endopeptidase MepM/ murein hydrolase activator NlpD
LFVFLLIGLSFASLVSLPPTLLAQDVNPLETPTEVVIGAPPAEPPTLTPDLRPPTETPDPNAPPAPTVDPIVQDQIAEQPTVENVLPTAVPVLPTFTPVPLPQSNDPNERVVSVGETLFTLAAQSGFTVNDLGQLNALTNPGLLLAGQKVKLPAPISQNIRLHRVAAGETLVALAAQYAVSPALLKQANQLVCSTCLVVGQLLRVPQNKVITNLPAPFETVDVAPYVPRQGDTIVVRVRVSVPLENIVGSIAGRPLNFVMREENFYIGLSGVGAFQQPGVYSITLRAIAKNGEASLVNGRFQVGQGNFGFETLNLAPKLVPLLDPQVNQAERDDLDAIFSSFSANQFWNGALKLPVNSKIVSYYGTRRNFNRNTLNTYHSGVDVTARVGTPVQASAPGRVATTRLFNIRGNVVILDHGRGVFTVYCHLSKFNVEEGQIVDVGDVIGFSGNTGRSLGPHVHWELAVGGVTVNPLAWVDEEIP